MDYFLKLLLSGTAKGSIYALMALGYTMVYGIIQLIICHENYIGVSELHVGFFSLAAFGSFYFYRAARIVYAERRFTMKNSYSPRETSFTLSARSEYPLSLIVLLDRPRISFLHSTEFSWLTFKNILIDHNILAVTILMLLNALKLPHGKNADRADIHMGLVA